ncbi:MAG: hypothetical protein Q4G51_07815 [Dermatophilus congolensis]|nr:hypothetical protein [Dermatophilus congolensis]
MSVEGVTFPRAGEKRSSVAPSTSILADAVRADSPELASRFEKVENWRRDYAPLFLDLTRLEASDPEVAMRIARTGLQAAADRMVFAAEGEDKPVAAGLDVSEPRFDTITVNGSGPRAEELVVEYKGKRLSGDALLRQLDDWVRRGITEPSFAEAVGAVVRNPEWLDLRDRTFGVIGAASQMGPYKQLMSWGATVAAIDLPRPGTWFSLAATAARGAGTLLAPSREADSGRIDTAGANVLAEIGPLTNWLAEVPGPLTVGNYTYADGGLFVRLSVAVDAMLARLTERRDDLSFTYLASPADAFTVPMDAVAMAQERDAALTPAAAAGRAIRLATRGKLAKQNYDGNILETATGPVGLMGAIIAGQGPNYLLAKRLQRWRMEVARAEGMLASVHVAPPTRTESVHHNAAMAHRQHVTAPLGIETFDAEATEALAGAILVHDLRNPLSPARPEVPLANPLDMFHFAANPGGRWRIPLDIESSLSIAEQIDVRTIQAREASEKAQVIASSAAETMGRLMRSVTKRPQR